MRLNCPCCGREDALLVTIDPGEPSRGPSYSSGGEPGIPAGIDDIDAQCGCYASGLVDTDKYDAAVMDAALCYAREMADDYAERD